MNLTGQGIKLRGRRLLVTKPVIDARERKVGDGTLYAPAVADSSRRSFALEATVVKVGPGVSEKLSPGDRVLVDEFAGVPLWSEDADYPLWLVGEGEIMAVLDGGADGATV